MRSRRFRAHAYIRTDRANDASACYEQPPGRSTVRGETQGAPALRVLAWSRPWGRNETGGVSRRLERATGPRRVEVRP